MPPRLVASMNCNAAGKQTPVCIRKRTSRTKGLISHLILLQHHKVEMLDALFRIFSHTLDKRRIRDDVTNILVNERIPFVMSRSERTILDTMTHLAMSSPARSPNPFFSVLTISILAYSRRWNLHERQRVANYPRNHHAPLVHTKRATLAVTGKALHLCQAIDAILYTNFIWEALSTPPLAQKTLKNREELTKAIRWTLAGHALQRFPTPP